MEIIPVCDHWVLRGSADSVTILTVDLFAHMKVRAETPGLLTNSGYSRFLIEWRNGHVKVKKNGSVLIEWQDPSPFGISHYGVRTAWGAQGHWRVHRSTPPGTKAF
jgi:hypothetical protein